MGKAKDPQARQKRPNRHSPHPDIVNIYTQLTLYRKADISGMAADEIRKAMLQRWPALKNVSLEPTLTWGRAAVIAGLGVCIGILVILLVMSL